MNEVYSDLATLLLGLEKELRDLGLWETESPSQDALASTQPFAVDTLAFHQWLQFIFLPRMYCIVETAAPLPAVCEIAPMAEQFFAQRAIAGKNLIDLLSAVDALVTEN